MKKIILLIGIIGLLLFSGCNNNYNQLLILKCQEAKEATLEEINLIEEYNNLQNYSEDGQDFSYENDVKTYNKLCGDITGKI
jgi:hypothetical protein